MRETQLEDVDFVPLSIERNSVDWLSCAVKDAQFDAACGPANLVEVLKVFQTWAECAD